MRTHPTRTILKSAALLLLLSALDSQLSTFAQGTAFTYQGRLSDSAAPANGSYDFLFTVWSVPTGGSTAIGLAVVTNGVPVSNGLFTVTLEFGAGVFTGPGRWLQIAVSTNGTGGYRTLSPRQPLTAGPYAIMAGNVSGVLPSSAVSGTYSNAVTFNNIANSFTGNGSALSNVNASTLGGLDSSAFWKTTGNAGTLPASNFIGTTDNQALLIRGGFVGIGRSSRITSAEYFGVEAPVSSGVFGGMYINTASAGGKPFYGYAQSGSARAYHYLDGNDGNKWKLYVGGDRVVVTQSGDVGIGTTAPADRLSVVGSVGVTNTTFAGGITLHNGGSPTAFYINDGSGERAALAFADGPGAYSTDAAAGDIVLRAASSKLLLQSGAGSAAVTVAANNNVGIGTANPQGNVHIYSGNNPTVVRVQSTGTPGFGRLEFVSDPQGSGSEWRPGYIQSLDTGGFTGGIGFFVNGTGFDNRFASNEVMRVINGRVGIGTNNPAEKLHVNGKILCNVITINGGSDLAEPFEISGKEIPPGAVVVIDEEHPGQLKLSERSYDTHVAGIVSGANGIHPGIQLQQEGVLDHGQNVALTGRVYALADAASGPIKPGDLLTSSSVPGHCMKASDRDKSHGAILGKAMTGLKEGRGKVLVLVTLQ